MKYTFKPITSLNEVAGYTKYHKDTLVVFDIDYVLTHPIEPAFQFYNIKKHISFVLEVFEKLSPEQKDILSNLMVQQEPGCELIETDAPLWIKKIQDEGVLTIALSAAVTFPILNTCSKKYKEQLLKENNISFGKHFLKEDKIIFRDFEGNYEHYPEFYNGILFCNGENQKRIKGDLIKRIYSQNGSSLKQIIFVDDRIKNLDDYKLALSDSPIEVVCLLYEGCLKDSSSNVDSEIFKQKWFELRDRAIKIDQKLKRKLT